MAGHSIPLRCSFCGARLATVKDFASTSTDDPTRYVCETMLHAPSGQWARSQDCYEAERVVLERIARNKIPEGKK